MEFLVEHEEEAASLLMVFHCHQQPMPYSMIMVAAYGMVWRAANCVYKEFFMPFQTRCRSRCSLTSSGPLRLRFRILVLYFDVRGDVCSSLFPRFLFVRLIWMERVPCKMQPNIHCKTSLIAFGRYQSH